MSLTDSDSLLTSSSLTKRKAFSFSPFTDYDVWLMEGIREKENKCEECAIVLCMTENLPPMILDASNLIKKEPHGDSFRYRDLILVRKSKGGKDFFVAK